MPVVPDIQRGAPLKRDTFKPLRDAIAGVPGYEVRHWHDHATEYGLSVKNDGDGPIAVFTNAAGVKLLEITQDAVVFDAEELSLDNRTINNPTIVGGTLTDVTFSGIELTNPDITGGSWSAPALTGGTWTTATLTNSSWTGGQIINAPISNPTIANPVITIGAVKAVAGILATPAGYTFNGDEDTGVEQYGANALGLKAGGVRYVEINHGHTANTGQLVTIARTDANTGTILQLTQGNGTTGSAFLGYALAIDSHLASTTNGGIALRSHMTARSGTDGFWTAGEFMAEAKSGWTPTTGAAGPIGIITSGISDRTNTTAWGANIKSRAKGGATGTVMCGIEVNMQAEPGSGVIAMYGVQVVPTTVDTGTGNSPTPSGTSIGYRLIGKAVSHGDGTWRYGAQLSHGILIENLSGNSTWASGSFPLQAGGTAFEVKSNYSGSPQTIANGVVFTDITMTGHAWKTANSLIQGANGFASFGSATTYLDAPLALDAQSQTYLLRVANGPTAVSAGSSAGYIPIVYNGSIVKLQIFANA